MNQVVVNRLLALTNDLNKDIKIAAIQALGEGSSPTHEIESRLLQLTNDLNKDIKIAAINALGRIYRRR
ncbi:HEAT repeat domain-containing protein [Pantoea agglomerans]|uniref:HEAT repeat domain-containing protein n=1 Tax=Enterobacter agglomerans TaxID=549 RepID=UPI001F2CAB2A|nr:HEAT repeat domain-containing protein [Pantoea agglomerans]UIL51532.1 HEAT repeat domain-containing protein [Pantoea agglomerans]